MEHLPGVILQSHTDMVCEKNSTTQHNFMTDPITPIIDGEWVKAQGTTLGADDGIGIAAQLSVLASTEVEHAALECLFTVDEETGLTGAFALEEGFLKGKILINLDSEEEGEIFIGCAGGVDTVGYLVPEYENTPSNSFAFKINVSGLKGGHSGDDIHRGLANANKLITRYIWEVTKLCDFKLSSIKGGNLRNAIAREAEAVGVVPYSKKEEVRVVLNCMLADMEEEFAKTEPSLKLNLASTDMPAKIYTSNFQSKLINTLYAMPHGVLSMSQTIPGLVETSTNLASVKEENNKVLITTSQRSAIESALTNAANMVESLFLLSGAEITHSDGYPGWAPNTDSKILAIANSAYQKIFNTKPQVKAIHAGLECGLFLKKYPELDMISIGPTIRGAHSPDERIHIDSVNKFYILLLEILKM
jgi:dipeptidase D